MPNKTTQLSSTKDIEILRYGKDSKKDEVYRRVITYTHDDRLRELVLWEKYYTREDFKLLESAGKYFEKSEFDIISMIKILRSGTRDFKQEFTNPENHTGSSRVTEVVRNDYNSDIVVRLLNVMDKVLLLHRVGMGKKVREQLKINIPKLKSTSGTIKLNFSIPT